MPATVKKIVLWRTEVDNKPGALANTIEPPAKAGADLQIVMGYRHGGPEGKATIEVYPIAGKKLMAAAQAVASAGVNFTFFVAHVIGRKYSAVAGFESEDDAKKAVPLIKQALVPKR